MFFTTETLAASRPEAGFAGREASRDVLRSPPLKEGARGGTMGSPALETVAASWPEASPALETDAVFGPPAEA